MAQLLKSLWASPTTAIGLLVGGVGSLSGARWQVRQGVLECYGGLVTWLLEHATLLKGGAMAMTLGEVILGRSQAALDLTRAHEHVHVKQARAWGPLFIPAYLLASVIALLRRKNPYRDNAFERQAFALSDPRHQNPPHSPRGRDFPAA